MVYRYIYLILIISNLFLDIIFRHLHIYIYIYVYCILTLEMWPTTNVMTPQNSWTLLQDVCWPRRQYSSIFLDSRSKCKQWYHWYVCWDYANCVLPLATLDTWLALSHNLSLILSFTFFLYLTLSHILPLSHTLSYSLSYTFSISYSLSLSPSLLLPSTLVRLHAQTTHQPPQIWP